MHGHVSIAVHSSEAFGREFTTAIDAVASAIEQDRPDLAPVASPEGTLTIMFTDIEASTATNEALGDDAFLPLLIRHNQIVEGHTEAASGSVVKSQGDGYMLAFPSARRAVDCAISVQRDVCALDERIKVRMGLHTGEPRRHAEDFYGRDVAYAARLGAAAGGGQILVSSLVKSLVEPSGSVRFDGPRKLELKGFEGPQPVYEVLWCWPASTRAARAGRGCRAHPAPRSPPDSRARRWARGSTASCRRRTSSRLAPAAPPRIPRRAGLGPNQEQPSRPVSEPRWPSPPGPAVILSVGPRRPRTRYRRTPRTARTRLSQQPAARSPALNPS